ncbi:MAG: ParB/RepB/Spo0J family partition protein [Actinobacteria bacterium]|nr:ParB/RepB/Spo0J family partition protein [Actinomycetota bacterium]
MNRKGGLGRNLDALIPASAKRGDADESQSNTVAIDLIIPNTKQPRTYFDQSALEELAQSIKEVGLLQPPVVRKISNGKYELIMGERRFRAAKIAGLKEIPVVIRQTEDNELLREALIENIHRSELNALEEAAAYSQLLGDLGVTHEELALKLGKSRTVITNTLRLLNLPVTVQKKLVAGLISAGHARALLGLSNEVEVEKLAQRIINENLTVRAIEEIVAISLGKSPLDKKGRKREDGSKSSANSSYLDYLEIIEKLEETLNTRVKIEKRKIIIEYGDGIDLQRITKIINEKS